MSDVYTAEHAASEDRVAQLVKAKWDMELVRMPRFSPVDWYGARDSEVKLWAEAKCRSRRVPTIGLSVRKYAMLIHLSIAMDIPAMFIVGLPGDEVRYCDVRWLDATRVHMFGRTDRGRANDIEPAIILDTDWLKLI